MFGFYKFKIVKFNIYKFIFFDEYFNSYEIIFIVYVF